VIGAFYRSPTLASAPANKSLTSSNLEFAERNLLLFASARRDRRFLPSICRKVFRSPKEDDYARFA
jgi:hypothetical protein